MMIGKRMMIVALAAVMGGVMRGADTLRIDLNGTISMAQSQSPEVQRAKNSFLSAYWNYRYYSANYLPSVSLSSTPYINKEINKITQADGSDIFIKQDQLGADLTLTINQNVALTGGHIFVKSSLTRLDELRNRSTAYSSQPIVLGYEQSLFGYNSLKWDRRIEPVRYREAAKQYAETLELVSADASINFFSLASAMMELEMAKQNFASADTLYQMAKGRYDIGTITENEMLQLEINRLNEETNVMDAQISLEEQMRTFRSFLGLEQDVEIEVEVSDSVPAFEVSLQRALDLATENSPDMEYYKRIRMESKSNLAYAKAGARLKADLYFQLGLSQTGEGVSDAFRNLNSQEYARISISLPLLDWGRGKGKVRVAESQLALTNTQAEQGMRDFNRNVQKLVMQFNMQARKVKIASMTSKRAEQRHIVAKRLYILGRSSILDLNSAISEKNYARRSYLSALQSFWTLYFTLRSMTAYDFEHDRPLIKNLPIK